MGKIWRLGFLASHGGSNMQAIIDICKDCNVKAVPCVVISNNGRSKALERARREGIPGFHISGCTHPESEALDRAICATLQEHRVDLVILAGYMKRLGQHTIFAYQGHILNIHPALLPKFGGQGLYGQRVHEAVLAAGEIETGVTVHIVNHEYDRGPIIAQCIVPILPGDAAETLAKRVLEKEHQLYPETIKRITNGDIFLPNLPIFSDSPSP